VDRSVHGAILDATLLSSVFIKLTQERDPQASIIFNEGDELSVAEGGDSVFRFPKRNFKPNDDELARHAAMLTDLKNPIWSQTTPVAAPKP
jgi:hypothetical protein